MNRPIAVLTLILAVLLSVHLAQGQQTTAPNETQNADAVLREKALKLLQSLADQLGTLQSAENRARIGSNIADSLWPHDETRARQLFKLVEEDIKLGLQKPDNDPESQHSFQVFLKLREDNVERIARHDPEVALAFLKETFVSVAEAVRQPHVGIPRNILESEHALELRLAKRIGVKDTNVTLQLARQSLEHGLSRDLVPLVLRLNEKNKDEAQSLYKDIVRRIASSDFDEYSAAAPLTQQLILRFAPPQADVSTYKELVDIFLKQAFAAKCDQPNVEQSEEGYGVCNYIAVALPYIERYSPTQVRRLSRLVPQSDENTPPWVFWIDSELNDVAENGTVDELLSLATKYPEAEYGIYWRAIAMAQARGDAETAKRIVNNYRGNPNIRRALENQIAAQNSSEEQLENQLGALRKNNVSMAPQPWVRILLAMADQAARNNPKFALKLLAESEATINTFKPGEEQTQLQIQLAATYCAAKDDHGFAIMESLLPKLNDLVTAAAKLDGYDTHYLRDGEWNMSAGGSVGNLLTILAGNAGYFAWYDFDRAVSLAGQFERGEIRMMAQLKLAQGILAGPSRPPINRAYSRFLY